MNAHRFLVHTYTAPDGQLLRYAELLPKAGATKMPLVFIPGLGGSVKNSLLFLDTLCSQGHPIYCLDGRGVGLNEYVAFHSTPGRYLADFKPWAQALTSLHPSLFRKAYPPVLIGLSLGSILGTLYLIETPQHPFKGFVMVAPAFQQNPSLFNAAFRIKNYLRILTKGIGAVATMPYSIVDITQNTEFHNDPHFKDPLRMPMVYLQMVEWLCKKAARLAPTLALPTFVVVPEADKICCAATMKQTTQQLTHPDSVTVSYPDLYHDVLMEPPEHQAPVIADLEEWLQRVMGSSAHAFSDADVALIQ